MADKERVVEVMDEEWKALIVEAKNLGLSKETVRNFLIQNQVKELITENH